MPTLRGSLLRPLYPIAHSRQRERVLRKLSPKNEPVAFNRPALLLPHRTSRATSWSERIASSGTTSPFKRAAYAIAPAAAPVPMSVLGVLFCTDLPCP